MIDANEHPIITVIRSIRDKWRVISGSCIGTQFEGSNLQRLAADRGNEADKLLWQFIKEDKKLRGETDD